MPRARFQKTGNARFLSHLDLMRLFQRAFKRAGLPLTHSQGYNPRPSVSIALPMSLGVESDCELLDFALEESVDSEEICARLNSALVEGIRVVEVYEQGETLKNLALLQSRLIMEYDRKIPDGSTAEIERIFSQPELLVEKKGKNGVTQQNVIPLIRRLSVCCRTDRELEIRVLHCCQNPLLNPLQISAAITKYLPDLAADYVRCFREELYDGNEVIFR